MGTRHLGATTLAAAMLTGAAAAPAVPLASVTSTIRHHRVQVDGVGIFYREVGPREAPTIVLLHGFPSSSREFDALIPLLVTRYHLVAPDFPGLGQGDAPPPSAYAYTFDHLAETTDHLLSQLRIDRYTLCIRDYGTPVGFRVIADRV